MKRCQWHFSPAFETSLFSDLSPYILMSFFYICNSSPMVMWARILDRQESWAVETILNKSLL